LASSTDKGCKAAELPVLTPTLDTRYAKLQYLTVRSGDPLTSTPEKKIVLSQVYESQNLPLLPTLYLRWKTGPRPTDPLLDQSVVFAEPGRIFIDDGRGKDLGSREIYAYKMVTTDGCGKNDTSILHKIISLDTINTVVDGLRPSVKLKFSAYTGLKGPLNYRIEQRGENYSRQSVPISNWGAQFDSSSGYFTTEEQSLVGLGFRHCFTIVATQEQPLIGTSRSNTICFDVENKISIPNIVTMNGDAANATWQIPNLELYAQRKLQIFNKWGKQVYSTASYDGNWPSANTEPGTYYYFLQIGPEATSKTKPYKGWIEVVK
jgi:gliding motility-associated-like protein